MSLFNTKYHLLFNITFCAAIACTIQSVQSQNINVTTPFTSTNSGWYENTGVSFGFSIPGGRGNGSRVVGYGPGGLQPNISFSNGFGNTAPVFGGYSPNSGARFGFRRQGPNGGFSLGIHAAKGSRRSNVTTAPSLTVQNGYGGTLINGQTRPFVVGNIPVVGGQFVGGGQAGIATPYQPDNAVTRAMQSGQLSGSLRSYEEETPTARAVSYNSPTSSATQGDVSVKSIKAQRERLIAAKKQKLADTIAAAKELESQRKFIEARMKFREALSQTDNDSERESIKQLIKESKLK
ncbi:MAG: hypothetical protein AB8B55_08030 [Mariniblastus sp.]